MVKRLKEWVLRYKRADYEQGSEPHLAPEPNNERWSVSGHPSRASLGLYGEVPWLFYWVFSLFIQETQSHSITSWEWQLQSSWFILAGNTKQRTLSVCIWKPGRLKFFHPFHGEAEAEIFQLEPPNVKSSFFTYNCKPKSTMWIYEGIEDMSFAFKELRCLITKSCPNASVTPWTVACKAPLSRRFSRQEYWSGLPFPLLGDLPDPGIKPTSPVSPALQVNSLPLSQQGSPGAYRLLIGKKTCQQEPYCQVECG